jgi:hypothetical protein
MTKASYGIQAILVLLVAAVAAAADEPVAAVPTSIPDTTVPTVSCVQPALPDFAKATSKQLKAFQTDANAYADCVHKYIEERHAKARTYVNLQKAEVDAGNAAVQTLNGYFAEVRDLQDKQRAQSGTKSAN